MSIASRAVSALAATAVVVAVSTVQPPHVEAKTPDLSVHTDVDGTHLTVNRPGKHYLVCGPAAKGGGPAVGTLHLPKGPFRVLEVQPVIACPNGIDCGACKPYDRIDIVGTPVEPTCVAPPPPPPPDCLVLVSKPRIKTPE